ncbi:MAG: hypothetical protein ACREXW_01065 [Gammaproteobacteria bacterium]
MSRNDNSGEFEQTGRRRVPTDDQLLLGQLIEAVKGVRRDLRDQTDDASMAMAKLTERIERFESLAKHGRGILIGMGLASMGMGAAATKIVDLFWPS